MTKILVDTEIRKKLESIFGCRRETVSQALNGHTNSDQAKRIRTMAVKLGGSVKSAEVVKTLK